MRHPGLALLTFSHLLLHLVLAALKAQPVLRTRGPSSLRPHPGASKEASRASISSVDVPGCTSGHQLVWGHDPTWPPAKRRKPIVDFLILVLAYIAHRSTRQLVVAASDEVSG